MTDTSSEPTFTKRCEIIPHYPVSNGSLISALEKSLNIENLKLTQVPFYLLKSVVDGASLSPATIQEATWDTCLQTGHMESYDFPYGTVLAAVSVSFLPGVTDNPGRSLKSSFALFDKDIECYSGNLYVLSSDKNQSIDNSKLQAFFEVEMANTLIEKIDIITGEEFNKGARFQDITFPDVHIHHDIKSQEVSLDLSDDELLSLSSERCLALNLEELHAIKSFYESDEVKKDRREKDLPLYPTDVEIEVLAQTWSEHCKHKIFSSEITYTDERTGKTEVINSLYKSFIKQATKDIEKDGVDWLVSVFSDNAGIVRFDKNIDVCIKVETHNSPSALDPYGGAITGILGVNRDILGCGLGAKPIANTDVFCFASTELPSQVDNGLLPATLMEPAQLLKGVHKGVEDGGNKSGIPTVNGAITFDSSYAGKPLVFCGTIGTLPATMPDGRPGSMKGAKAGDAIIVSGGGVGADGIHGATFSSMELGEDSPATAVQIGDPITQKRVMDFLLEARDLGLYTCVTDNGAGGISSSIGEMAELTGGAKIDLSVHPTKYHGLAPWEIMISESQERMTFAVDQSKKDEFLALSAKRGVTSTVLGTFTDDGHLDVYYEKDLVASLPMAFLHDGVPQLKLKARWTDDYSYQSWIDDSVSFDHELSIAETLKTLLSRENIASKAPWVRQYDHEVQGATIVKPFSGQQGIGPDDSGVIDLSVHGGEDHSMIGVSCGMAPRWSDVGPELMPKIAVDEAFRNLVSTGINPSKVCLLDNFCWPDPVQTQKNPDGDIKLGQLVETCRGLYDICRSYKAPLVSGKDSMKNDFRGKNRKGDDVVISIRPTLLVTAMGHGDKSHVVRSHITDAGAKVYRIGPKFLTMVASELAAFKQNSIHGQDPYTWDFDLCLNTHKALFASIEKNLVHACHDISDGGALCALSEMLFDHQMGLTMNEDYLKHSDSEETELSLFGEGPGQYIVAVNSDNSEAFEKLMGEQNVEVELIGESVDNGTLKGGLLKESLNVTDLKNAWSRQWAL